MGRKARREAVAEIPMADVETRESRLARGCDGKRRYATERAARDGLTRSALSWAEDPASWNAYECAVCNWWHTGHRTDVAGLRAEIHRLEQVNRELLVKTANLRVQVKQADERANRYTSANWALRQIRKLHRPWRVTVADGDLTVCAGCCMDWDDTGHPVRQRQTCADHHNHLGQVCDTYSLARTPKGS